ncbi:MAG: hypothetical protein H0W62_05940 [Chitinophagales bacterium]|nr:hypothetical protein [Chitinophagales bacterium]
MFRYSAATLLKLEQLFRECSYAVRYEKGTFKSGYCILENKKVIVINKYLDTESRINSLLDILSQTDIDESLLSERASQFLKEAKSEKVKL